MNTCKRLTAERNELIERYNRNLDFSYTLLYVGIPFLLLVMFVPLSFFIFPFSVIAGMMLLLSLVGFMDSYQMNKEIQSFTSKSN